MKILIELPSWLGDAIMTTPAIENISNHLDSPEITLIGPFAVTEILKNNPIVSKVVVLEKNYFNIIRYARSLGHFDIYFSFQFQPCLIIQIVQEFVKKSRLFFDQNFV